MKLTRTHLGLALAMVSLTGLLMTAGCSGGSGQAARRAVTPDDFATPATSALADTADTAARPSPDGQQTPGQAASPASPPAAQAASPSATQPATSKPVDPLTMDAMVGQVNGRAIYAKSVFEPIEPQLAALGRTLPPSLFKQRATELVVGQLQTLVTNALILGEAERDLSVQERYGLVAMLQSRREEILRQFGQGSVAVADQQSLQRTGKTVDDQVKEYREHLLVGRYLANKINPRINVSRKDIERYYENNREQFNPPAGRTLRLILATSQADADRIQKKLDAGDPFDAVAASPLNQYRASSGGLMPNRITGDKFSGHQALNDAMVKLQAGEHSPRLSAAGSFWWVKVETLEDGKGRPLEEVQLEIRRLLESQQRDVLGMDFRRKLLEEGSYNPVDQMTANLVEIAMARYSQPQ